MLHAIAIASPVADPGLALISAAACWLTQILLAPGDHDLRALCNHGGSTRFAESSVGAGHDRDTPGHIEWIQDSPPDEH